MPLPQDKDKVKFRLGFGGPDGPMPNHVVFAVYSKQTGEFLIQYYLEADDFLQFKHFFDGVEHHE